MIIPEKKCKLEFLLLTKLYILLYIDDKRPITETETNLEEEEDEQ